MNSEAYRDILFTLIHFTEQIHRDPKYKAKATPVFEGKKKKCNFHVGHMILTWTSFIAFAEDKTKGRKTHEEIISMDSSNSKRIINKSVNKLVLLKELIF